MKRGIAQITDATIAWGVITVAIVTILIPLMMWAADEYRMNVAAGQANTVQKAVNRYIADQQATITAQSGPWKGYVLTVPMLISAGYLPSGFSSVNAYTSTYRTLIYQPIANKLHAMTFLTGGTTLSMSEARKLANHIGAAGGYIDNGTIKGALGSWEENVITFGGFNPGNGHVVIAGFYADGVVANDYLYRHNVAGHPELNAMGTALNMNGNDVANAKAITGQTLTTSGDVYASGNMNTSGSVNAAGNVTASGSVSATGNVNASGRVTAAQITSTQTIESGGTINATGNITSGKDILASGDVASWGNIRTTGNVNANNDIVANGTLRSDHDVVLGGVVKLGQVNTAGNYCDTWGAISRDAVGAVLSCQQGLWKLQSVALDTFKVNGSETCSNQTQVGATCPAGSKLVSGGYIMSRWADGSNHNSPDSVYPDPASNTFFITTPNNQKHNTCFIAVAVCSKQ